MSKEKFSSNDELVSIEDRAKEKPKKDAPVKEATATKEVPAKKKPKKEKKTLGRKIKEIFSELKKVSWPTFPKILKNTGIVLVVVLFFLVVLGVTDGLLAFLLGLIAG